MSQGKTKKEALANAEKAIKAYMKVISRSRKANFVGFAKRAVDISLPAFN